MIKITCILPAHNEEKTIRQTIMEIDHYISNNVDFSIFVSEDGSTDGTREEVLRASRSTTKVRVFLSSPSERLGYSKAIQRGIRECRTEFICFMDADGQYDPSEIPGFIDKLNGNEVLVGARTPRRDSLGRRIYSRLFRLVYNLLGGPIMKDPSSPFIFAATTDVSFLSELHFELNFGFWWEFHWRMANKSLQVIEIPVSHRKRHSGKTQVYTTTKLPRIVYHHLRGLYRLRKELGSTRSSYTSQG